jgi:pilus assembly protein CpaE
MSVINPNETARTWQARKLEPAVQMYLSALEGESAELAGARVAEFPIVLNIVPVSDWIEPGDLDAAAAAVIQVDADSPTSIKRFQKLAAGTSTPLIAATYEPPLAFVRSLIRAGAHDVIPLPLSIEELEASLGPIREELAKRRQASGAATGKLVTVLKSAGGVGATALTTQLAIRLARSEAAHRRKVCVLDLDMQFGDVAFQLGLQPRLSVLDLLEAGTRLDADLLQATTLEHSSGLRTIAAPPELMPLEGMPSEHLLAIVDLAAREFDTVFVDLPTNWTNWSLSLVARSNLILLVTELSVAALSRARRQLNLLQAQDLGQLDIRVIVNRYEKSVARTLRPAEVREALGRDISYTIANDFGVMRAAIERGVPIDEIKRKSAIGKDFDMFAAGISSALGMER